MYYVKLPENRTSGTARLLLVALIVVTGAILIAGCMNQQSSQSKQVVAAGVLVDVIPLGGRDGNSDFPILVKFNDNRLVLVSLDPYVSQGLTFQIGQYNKIYGHTSVNHNNHVTHVEIGEVPSAVKHE